MRWLPLTNLVALLCLAGCAAPGGTPSSGATSPQPETDRVIASASVPAASGSGAAMTDAALAPPEVAAAYGRAVLLLETGDQSGAESEFKRFIAAHPGYAGPHVNLSIIYTAQGRLDDAQAAIDTALTLNPQSAEAMNQQGILHRRNGQFTEAESAYLKAITVRPDYPLAHLNLGILNELYFGRLVDALEFYRSYQLLTPDEDPTVARWITDLTRRTGQN
ncbi:MAG: tetratricopeptide repeat protein [Pseudomonadota bacterium]